MKTFGKLKLLAIGVLLMAGMSSCLKSSDPGFGIAPYLAYIEQDGHGKSARFMPAMQLFGNQPIDVSLASPVCKFENNNYMFQAVAGSNNTLLELTSSMNPPVDTVKSWICSITAVSKTEEPEQASTSFSFRAKKALGEFDVESLAYSGTDSKVTGEWKKVENAEEYILVYRESSNRMWLPAAEFIVVEKDGKITANATLSGATKGATMDIAVAASNGTFWSIDGKKSITVGTDAK